MPTSRFAALPALAACFIAVTASAQRLSVGAIGGTNVTSNFPTTDVSTPADMFGNPANRFQFLSGPRSFVFGALVEIGLSKDFSIEANVLHRPMKSTIIFTEFPAGGAAKVSTNTITEVRAWEFPVMLKYSLPSQMSAGRLHPFLEGGPSFRTQQDAGATQPSQFGLSAGAGVAIHLGRVRVAPMLRYTRWS